MFGARLPILRAAAHAFYFLGLFVALWSLRSVGLGWATLALGAVALGAWAFPQHKLFEPALAMWAFAALQALVRSPGPGTAAAGATVGLALVFGFNLFLYFGAALALLLAWLLATSAASAQLLPWPLLGAAVAATPLLVPLVGSAAFRRTFIERRITAVLRRHHQSAPAPPVAVVHGAAVASGAHARAPQGDRRSLLLLLPALPWLWLVGLATSREVSGDLGAAALAAAALGAFAWHHAFSRADVSHLAQSVVPVLLLLLLAAARSPHPPLLALLIAVASVALVRRPSSSRLSGRKRSPCVSWPGGSHHADRRATATARLRPVGCGMGRAVPKARSSPCRPWPGCTQCSA